MKARAIRLAMLAATLSLSAACSTAYVYPPSAAPGVPATGAGATGSELATPGTGVQISDAADPAPQAPVCQASASCAALNAEQIPLQCVKKIPYTNVLVPRGTNFEVMDDSGQFSCIDSDVVVNGKEVLTCHGQELYSFQLKLSNAACGKRMLQAGSGQCADGYGYDAAQKCCAPVSDEPGGAVTVTVNLGACPLPNP